MGEVRPFEGFAARAAIVQGEVTRILIETSIVVEILSLRKHASSRSSTKGAPVSCFWHLLGPCWGPLGFLLGIKGVPLRFQNCENFLAPEKGFETYYFVSGLPRAAFQVLFDYIPTISCSNKFFHMI